MVKIPGSLEEAVINLLRLTEECRDLGIGNERSELFRSRKVGSVVESARKHPKIECPVHLLDPANDHRADLCSETLEIVDLDDESFAVLRIG